MQSSICSSSSDIDFQRPAAESAGEGQWEVLASRPFVDNTHSRSALARGLLIPGWSWRRVAWVEYVLLQRRQSWLEQAAGALKGALQ